MIYVLVYAVLSLGLGGFTFYLSGLYVDWIWFWVPVLYSLGYYLGFNVLHYTMCIILGAIFQRSKVEQYEPNRPIQYLMSGTACMFMPFLRAHVKTSGFEKLPPKDTCAMFVSNHLSNFDYISLLEVLRDRKMVAVSKKENERIIAVGGLSKKAGYISIHQNDMAEGARVIEKAAEFIKEGKSNVGICPEGTRNKSYPDPMMLPFKPGSFEMAKSAECPIVVMSFQNTNCVFKRFPLHRTNIYIDILDVIPYEKYKDMTLSEISNMTHEMILTHLEEKEARAYLHKLAL
ncbi:MAG: 1-acyl-sn-glycerol-3-phosphate acyltransferase [Bacilli bacterium]|nr:1-acyl-sn-glycerol-3-phosphate acyltransferase [Bacilli bacterium]